MLHYFISCSINSIKFFVHLLPTTMRNPSVWMQVILKRQTGFHYESILMCIVCTTQEAVLILFYFIFSAFFCCKTADAIATVYFKFIMVILMTARTCMKLSSLLPQKNELHLLKFDLITSPIYCASSQSLTIPKHTQRSRRYHESRVFIDFSTNFSDFSSRCTDEHENWDSIVHRAG